MFMRRLRCLVISTALMASVTFASSDGRTDDPVTFRDIDFTADEWQVIEELLMQPESDDATFWQPISIDFVHFIMMEKYLSQTEALIWIRENAVAIAYSDVTADGTQELLVMFHHDYLSGTGASTTVILERSAEEWRLLTDIDAYPSGLYGDPPPPYPLCVSDERLNGRPYFYSVDEVAYWDGTQYRWECVTRCEGSEPGDNPFGEKIAQNLGCILGE